MDNTDKIMWILLAGIFLLHTSRVLQATELWQECLILLSNTAQERGFELAFASIYAMLFQAYLLLIDHTSAINYSRKLLDFLRGFGLKAEEGQLTFQLAQLHYFQNKYKEAKEFIRKH